MRSITVFLQHIQRLLLCAGAGAVMLLLSNVAEAGFTLPAPLNSDARTAPKHDMAPAVATDDKGTWIAVWAGDGDRPVAPQGDDPYLPGGTNQDIFFSRSEDGGRTWSAKTALKTTAAQDDADDLEPSIATDGQGKWMVAWRSRDTLGGTIGYDADILMSQSLDNGKTWSAPAAVNNDAGSDDALSKDDVTPCVKSDGFGRWIIIFTIQQFVGGFRREGFLSTTYDDALRQWSIPTQLFGRRVNAPYLGIYKSRLAHDGQGKWILASAHRISGGLDSDIFTAITTNDGNSWDQIKGLTINTQGYCGENGSRWAEDIEADVATDGKGTWIVAWSSALSPTGILAVQDPQVTTPVDHDFDIQVVRSYNNGTTWTEAVHLNTNADFDDAIDDRNVRLATDGNGAWIASWETRMWGGDVDLAFAVSRDNGLTWSPPRSLNATAATDGVGADDGGTSGSMSLNTDRAGRWLAVWPSKWTMGGELAGDWNLMTATLDDPTRTFGQILGVTSPQVGFMEGTRYAVDVTKGGKPTTHPLEIRNDGLAPLTVKSLGISGPHATEFALDSPMQTPLVLAPDAKAAVTVRFAPKATQRTLGMNATLVVTSDDPVSSTTTVKLTGDAVPVELSGFAAE